MQKLILILVVVAIIVALFFMYVEPSGESRLVNDGLAYVSGITRA